MWNVTRSPALTPAKSRSSAANSFTRTYSSWYVMTWSCSSSGSATQMNAALFRCSSRCRSTQLNEALSLPPAHHFQNGGFDVSTVVCQYLSHVSSSAYSRKQSGKFSSENRSCTVGSAMFACAMNPDVGWMSSSSRQCEAIWASVTSSWFFESVILRPPWVFLKRSARHEAGPMQDKV